LRSETLSLSKNSSRLKMMAYEQQTIQDQLNQTINQMIDVSKETFSITPQMGKSIGKANNAIEQTKSDITNRNIRKAGQNQHLAMEGLNAAALNLFQSIQQMQASGSASGFEQFLKMMQQMAGKQQSLNQQGMNLTLGQMTASAQQQIMQSMLQGQKSIQKTLQELIKKIQQSGKQEGQGDLAGIAKDMNDVISDLSKELSSSLSISSIKDTAPEISLSDSNPRARIKVIIGISTGDPGIFATTSPSSFNISSNFAR